MRPERMGSTLLGSLRAIVALLAAQVTCEAQTEVDPPSELRGIRSALEVATSAAEPAQANGAAIRSLALRLAMFERRFGVHPEVTEGWSELNAQAGRWIMSFSDWACSSGGTYGCAPTSTVTALFEMAGRIKDARHNLFSRPLYVDGYSPWAPMEDLAALARDRAVLLQLEGDEVGALRAALGGCLYLDPCTWNDRLYATDIGLLLSDAGYVDEAILVLRTVVGYDDHPLATQLARDELVRLGDPPGGRAMLVSPELFEWECWRDAPGAAVIWDPDRRGSVRLLALRERAVIEDVDASRVHTLVDGLLPTRQVIDAMLKETRPYRQWWALLMLAGLDADAAERALPDLLRSTQEAPWKQDGYAPPVYLVVPAILGGGPTITHKTHDIREACVAWLEWLANQPSR